MQSKGELHSTTYCLHFLLLSSQIVTFQICTLVPLSSMTATVSRCCIWAVAYHIEKENQSNSQKKKGSLAMGRYFLVILMGHNQFLISHAVIHTSASELQ